MKRDEAPADIVAAADIYSIFLRHLGGDDRATAAKVAATLTAAIVQARAQAAAARDVARAIERIER